MLRPIVAACSNVLTLGLWGFIQEISELLRVHEVAWKEMKLLTRWPYILTGK